MALGILDRLQVSAEKNLLALDQAKADGRKVIGFYCLYSPTEIAVAANAITLGLCGTRNEPIAKAEETLPRNLCPLIKSSFGFAASGACPFFQLSDFIVADTTCDGKKKMFELLGQYRPVHVLQLPQNQDSAQALPFWINEVVKFKELVEKETGKTLSDQDLRESIKLLNRERRTKKRLMEVAATRPSPISGMDLLEILFKIGFFADREESIRLMEEVILEINEQAKTQPPRYSADTPRILLTGVPVGIGSEKVIKIAEEAGANVVCMENCSGYKQTFQVDEIKDPIEALAEAYLDIPCSVMSPNTKRLDLIAEIIEKFQVDKVIDLTWQACHTYNVESHSVEQFVKDRFSLPFLHLETDYAVSDTEQLRTRIEAFLEL